MSDWGWTIVVPLKRLPRAKSRLRPASAGPIEHARLIAAIRADTVSVAATVGRVVLVYDEPPDDADGLAGAAATLVQTRAGLNEALADAALEVGRRWPGDGLAALVGDLPALTTAELAAALQAASEWPRAFVPDLAGTGTTLLTAAPGVELRPAFGAGSAGRHEATARRLDAGPGLRLDVDTEADLLTALRRGVGPRTRRAQE